MKDIQSNGGVVDKATSGTLTLQMQIQQLMS